MSPERRESRQEASLRRLSAVAPLGPGPAVAVARAVLGRLRDVHLGGEVHGGVGPEAVLVAEDGSVRLAGEPAGPGEEPAPAGLQRADVAAAWAMARMLLDASAVTTPALLDALLAAPPPAGGAGAALSAVSAAAGELAAPSGEGRAAARLAELAGPLIRYRHGPPQVTAGALGAATVITAGERRPVPRAAPAPPPARRHRRRVAAAALAAAAAAAGAVILVTRGSAGPVPPLTAGAPATALPGPPPPPPIPAPPPAGPPSAGVVAAVRLTPAAGPCLPAQVCALQVSVDLAPHRAATTTVRLVVELVDRCTGARSEVRLAPRRVTAAGATAGWAARLRVPAGPAPALIAVVVVPARAASAPLLVAPYLPTC